MVLFAVLAAVVGVSSALASGGSITAFKVTSTLDGKKVLPLQIRWIGRPQIALSQVTKVEFLVDGHWLWTEHQAPYVYGGNDGSDENWLFTSFLKPGRHSFTVRVFTKSGTTGTDTVRARVIQAPPPPPELAGTWKHHVTGSCGACDRNHNETVSISTTGWGFTPHATTDKWDARYLPDTKVVFGPLVVLPGMSPGQRQGGFCNGIDPFHTWTYTVASDDNSFQLQPVGKDPCPDRQHGLEGAWTRVG